MDAGQRKGSDIARMIWIVGSPILFTIGVIGNIMTIIVLSSKHNKQTSTTVFLTTLAFADFLVMVIVQPRWWFIYTFGVDVRYLGNAFCKLQWFFAYFAGTYSTLLLVAVTIERVISTIRPYKVKTWCNVNRAVTVSVSLGLLLCSIYGHVFYGLKLIEKKILENPNNSNFHLNSTKDRACDSFNMYNGTGGNIVTATTFADFEECIKRTRSYPEITTSPFEVDLTTPDFHENDSIISSIFNNSITSVNTNRNRISMTTPGLDNTVVTVVKLCWYDDPHYGEFYSGIFQTIHFCVYTVFPEFVFLVSGTIITWKLYRSSQWRKQMTQDRSKYSGNNRNRNSDTQATQITRTLLLVNIVFIVCTTPVFIYMVGRPFWVDTEKGMTEAQEIIWAICNQLYFLNHATNFILYFLSGSRFRQQVVKTFSRKKRHNLTQGTLSHISSS